MNHFDFPASVCFFEVSCKFGEYDTVPDVITKIKRYFYAGFKVVDSVDHKWVEDCGHQYLVLLVQGTSFKSAHDLSTRFEAQVDRLLSGGIGGTLPTYYTPSEA